MPQQDNKQPSFKLVLSCATGFETLLLDECREILERASLHEEAQSLQAANACVVVSTASLKSLYLLCLYSRLAEQVLMDVLTMELEQNNQALARDTLYKQVSSIAWHELFDVDKSFRVDISGEQNVFDDARFAALVCKDAIVDCFRLHYEKRPSIKREQPDVIVSLFMEGTQFSVQLNVSGERLHKRGYRVQSVEAPLRETLAAALLHELGWHRQWPQVGSFIDPCCGSGTLLIEALLMAADIAPGLLRANSEQHFFSFEHLLFHQTSLWQMLLSEANERKQSGLLRLQKSHLKLRAYDSDAAAIKACQQNLASLELQSYVHVEKRSLAQLYVPKLADGDVRQGVLVCNPPYGERLQEGDELKYLYRFLGERLADQFSGWHVGVISNHVELLDALGFQDFRQARFYNGNLKCLFRHVTLPVQVASLAQENYFLQCVSDQETLEEADVEALDFHNRLLKNLKKLKGWIQKNGIQQFRLYDADIPEFNIAVDAYQQGNKAFLIVAEYAAPKSIDEALAKQRFKLALQTLRRLFRLHREQVYIKVRQRQKGKSQYESTKKSTDSHLLAVKENGLTFLLNTRDYLDSGLFLDHRIMRQTLREQARGKRFLNLFAYTGSASVYAAAGGARSTLTVDLSANYLAWARKNLLANGFSLNEHRTEASDSLSFLEKSKEQFDLIFIDPPTFSNTRKKGLRFDVQEDHERLISLAMARLDPDGTLYFSCNFRRFQFSEKLKKQFRVEDISARTQSPDFSRRQPHQSWRISRA